MVDNPELQEGALEAAFRDYEEHKERYQALIAEHPEVFAEWFDLLDDVFDANERVRSHLREASYGTIGGFKRSIAKKKTVDVGLLTRLYPQARQLEGLIVTTETVNKEVLEGYILDGTIPQDVVDNATITEDRITVRGPKTFKGLDKL